VSKFSNSPLVQVAGGLYFCYVSDRYQITQILKKNQTDVNRTSKIQKKPSIQDPKGESRKTKSITISKKRPSIQLSGRKTKKKPMFRRKTK
jgi:hypothetical protein